MKSDLIDHKAEISQETSICLEWLGVYSSAPLSGKRGWAVIDEFCARLEHKLSYLPGERDMVVMYHKILVELGDGRRQLHSCSFVGYGQERGPSIMAATVGLTAAAGAHLILSGLLAPTAPAPGDASDSSHTRNALALTGILTPTIPEIYLPALDILHKEGIKFVEEIQDISRRDIDLSRRDVDLSRSQETQGTLSDETQADVSKFFKAKTRAKRQQRIWPFVALSEKQKGHQD